jgi:hypothetical protein
MMNDMMSGIMGGMGLVAVLNVIVLVLGAAALALRVVCSPRSIHAPRKHPSVYGWYAGSQSGHHGLTRPSSASPAGGG